MKILLSHRYFWPDTPPYASMLRSIAARLAGDGHDVTVFSTQPSYHGSHALQALAEEELDGFHVTRVPIFKEKKGNPPLRALNVLTYAQKLRRHILKVGNYDVVMASTFPPIVAGRTAARAAQKIGARFFYHCMDIHPEVSLYSGQIKSKRLVNYLQHLDSKTCHMADEIIVLSQDMRNTVCQRPGNETLKPRVINNFLLEDFEAETSLDPVQLPSDKFTILFAGNLGNFQNLDLIISAAHELADLDEVQFWFVGEGAAKNRLIKQSGNLLNKSIFFVEQQPARVAQNLMGQSNLNLVSLMPNIYRVSYPSKTMVSLSRSGPILAIIEPDSELAKMVIENNIGYTAPADHPTVIVQSVRQAYKERHLGPTLRENTSRLYEDHFSKDLILDRWSELFSNPGVKG